MSNPSFSRKYVMSVTFQHMKRAVDISIDKTISRLDELENSDFGAEVMTTLSQLHAIKRTLNQYVESNPQMFE